MLKDKISGFSEKFLATILRFPIPCFFCIAYTIVEIIRFNIHQDYIDFYYALTFRLILVAGVFWFIALKLFAERMQWSAKLYYTVAFIIFLVIILQIDYYKKYLNYLFLIPGLFFSISITPFLIKKTSNNQVWEFNYHLCIHSCYSIIAVIILSIVSFLTQASIGFLFDFGGRSYLLLNVLPFFVLPLIGMAGIPNNYDLQEKEYPKSLKMIMSYIILPMLLLYSVILYVYMIKIIYSMSLPNGKVSLMVSIFGYIGIISYLITYPLHNTPGISKLFSRYFFKILIAPVILLVIAIGVRINEYGITEERYIILLFAIWFALSIFFVLTKYQNQALKLILISKVLLLLLASTGPWGALEMSSRSQISRLKKLLEQNNVLVNDRIHAPSQAISKEDSIKIASIVTYLHDTKKSYRIKIWFSDLNNVNLNHIDNYLRNIFVYLNIID